jgi:hypothetical protein
MKTLFLIVFSIIIFLLFIVLYMPGIISVLSDLTPGKTKEHKPPGKDKT